MSIQEFYQKFVSVTENNALVESLRRLSILDDPKAMLKEDPTWVIWNDGEAAASQA